MAETNLPATGSVGVAPPADAPIEVSLPLTDVAKGEMLAKARANERTLAPLVYEGAKPLESAIPGKSITEVDPFYARLDELRAKNPMPAASNTDSPTRGIPGTAPVPPSRKTGPLPLSGGFGDGGEAQYYPLTGLELKALVEGLMDELHTRLQNDLRFSIAICYPRVRATVQVVIEAEATAGDGFEVNQVTEYDKTPLEVAKQYGDSVVFVVTERRQEFTAEGVVDSPPDALRDELGLPKPSKRMIVMGGSKQLADLPIDAMGF